jgi:anti-sigma B factor antagonist
VPTVDDRVGRLEVDGFMKTTDPGSAEVEFGVATQVLGMRTCLVSAYGDVDPVTAPEFEREVLETVHTGARRVVVDLTSATFFDSSAVRALVRAGERLQSDGLQFGIVCGNPNIKRVLEITGADQTFQVHAAIESRPALFPRRGGAIRA